MTGHAAYILQLGQLSVGTGSTRLEVRLATMKTQCPSTGLALLQKAAEAIAFGPGVLSQRSHHHCPSLVVALGQKYIGIRRIQPEVVELSGVVIWNFKSMLLFRANWAEPKKSHVG